MTAKNRIDNKKLPGHYTNSKVSSTFAEWLCINTLANKQREARRLTDIKCLECGQASIIATVAPQVVWIVQKDCGTDLQVA
jgi:hypothetical protein